MVQSNVLVSITATSKLSAMGSVFVLEMESAALFLITVQ